MKERTLAAIMIIATFFIVGAKGCEPSIIIRNNTTMPVRVSLAFLGQLQLISLSPGESFSQDATEGDVFSVLVFPDKEWINYVKDVRKYLSGELANPEKLTELQRRDLIQRLKDIAAIIAQYEKAAKVSAGCQDSVPRDGDGIVQITTRPDGQFLVTCK